MKKQPKYSRRTRAILWVLAVSVVIGVLIYFELISVLYVLATLALVALLVIVGMSDLESVGREEVQGLVPEKE